MIPFLTYPLALLAALAIPVLVAVYFFRTRFRRHPVSSLMLWNQVARPREGGSRVRRLTVPLSFFLELLALLFLVIAATDPRWASGGSRKPLIVVLDDSVSMQARAPDGTPREHALREIRNLCRRPDTGLVRFIIAGKTPRVTDSMKPDSPAVAETLKQWTCFSPASCLDRALSLACEIGQGRSRIAVLTDHRPPAGSFTGDRALWKAFGDPSANAGIVNAARTSGETKDRCMLEIAQYGRRPADVVLSVDFGPGTPVTRHVLGLQTGAVKRLVFDLPPDTPIVRASLERDALEADNLVALLPAPVRPVKVRTEITHPDLRKAVENALRSTGLQAPAGPETHLLITDRRDAVETRPETWIVRILGGASAVSYTGPYVMDTGHPLVKGTVWEGVIWGLAGTHPPPGLPVLTVGDSPVISDRLFPSGKHEIQVRMDLSASTLQNTPNWPILFWNLLNWRAAEAGGLSDVNLRLGADAILTLDRITPVVTIRNPDGAETQLKSRTGRIPIDADRPGLYSVTAGTRAYAFACNLLSPEESDLGACDSGSWGRWADTESLKKDYAESAWIFLLLALGTLTGHLFLVKK